MAHSKRDTAIALFVVVVGGGGPSPIDRFLFRDHQQGWRDERRARGWMDRWMKVGSYIPHTQQW